MVYQLVCSARAKIHSISLLLSQTFFQMIGHFVILVQWGLACHDGMGLVQVIGNFVLCRHPTVKVTDWFLKIASDCVAVLQIHVLFAGDYLVFDYVLLLRHGLSV